MKVSTGEIHAGPAGSATQVVVSDIGPDDRQDIKGTVGVFFIHAPGQSPIWDKYFLSVVHLRDIPGAKPAILADPHATHEFHLGALDPDNDPSPERPMEWVLLHPLNLVWQTSLPDDVSALYMLEECAKKLVAGELWAEPPLAGQREPWRSFLQSLNARRKPNA